VAFDDARDLLPVPYLVYERVRGETLGGLDLDPERAPDVWRELGRDLARLYVGVAAEGPVAALRTEPLDDPRPWVEELVTAGQFTVIEARWLTRWLDRLAPLAIAPVPDRFLHGDVQATNVMVQPGSLSYLALIDWGAAGWGDPAQDIAAFPLRAVPMVLAATSRRSTVTTPPRRASSGATSNSPSGSCAGRPNRVARGQSGPWRCCGKSCASSWKHPANAGGSLHRLPTDDGRVDPRAGSPPKRGSEPLDIEQTFWYRAG
jgi:hypothetical protein